MREILFRGKTKDGEWVQGFYCNELYAQKHYIQSWYYGSYAELQTKEVIPETVGQFTGVYDINCKKIFEGDIVKLFDMIGVVFFEEGCFGLGIDDYIDYDYLEEQILPVTGCDNLPHFLYNDNFISFWELLWNYNAILDVSAVCEVIGNIHDNPELLQ